jgi:hypothetical protein
VDLKILFTTTMLLVLFSGLVLAIPGIPHAFKGSVTVNGAPAPDGTTVTAKINGIEVASTTTSGGTYGYPAGTFYVSDPQNTRSGDTVNFFVNGVDTGESAIFCNGCITELDLSATIETGDGDGNGGNGGGKKTTGGGTITTETPEEQEEEPVECVEKWVCTDWSACVDGLQTRTCTDENSCGTEEDKPLETQPCVEEEGGILGPTGLFTLTPVNLSLLILLLAILGLLGYMYKKGMILSGK